MLGMTVSDVSGKAIANLATEELKHPAPVFHGDTLFVESEVLEVTPSRSKPDRGIVKVKTDAYKQDGTLVATFKRPCSCPKTESAAKASEKGEHSAPDRWYLAPPWLTNDDTTLSAEESISDEISERVRSVLAAAESAATAIRHEAEQQVQSKRRAAEAERQRYLEDAKAEAEALLEERMKRIRS